jgi:tyrosyl-DNA phosphodiesterase 2
MSPALSREDLRAKRLRALLGEQQGAVVVAAAAPESQIPPVDDDAAAATAAAAAPAASRDARAEIKNPPGGGKEVIDLLWLSDSDGSGGEAPHPDGDRRKPKRHKKEAEMPTQSKRSEPKRSSSASAPSRRSDESGADAQQLSADEPGSARPSFEVATWNVWFGPQAGPNPHVGPRMAELARILRGRDRAQQQDRRSPLWFVGFQEVTPEAEAVLQAELPEYRFVRQRGDMPYWCTLAVRQRRDGSDPTILEAGCVDYHVTRCGRAFCYARVRLPASPTEVLVATTHLESYLSASLPGRDERRAQLEQFQEFARGQLRSHPALGFCLLTGDYNYDDCRPKPPRKTVVLDDPLDKVLALPFADAWLDHRARQQQQRSDLGGGEECYTYDGQRNPMLKNNLRRRFDRCVAVGRTPAQLPRTASAELLGTDPLPGLTWVKRNPYNGAVVNGQTPTMVSDHYGFLAELSFAT